MTCFAIDAPVALRLIDEGVMLPDGHALVGPNRLRSDALAILFAQACAGERSRDDARATLEKIAAQRIRLLADRVSRAAAWRVAEQLGWSDTSTAEYIAVAGLQADLFVTLDLELARRVSGVVETAPFEALLRAGA
jgi:hypothetical protein